MPQPKSEIVRHIEEDHDFAAIRDLQEELTLYGAALILSVFNGLIRNVGAKPPLKPPQTIQKADQEHLEKYLKRMKWILGQFSSLRPDEILDLGGRPLYKQNGLPLTAGDWKKLERKIDDFLTPRLNGLAEELTAKTFLLALMFLEAQLQGKEIKDKSYKAMADDYFGGALPHTIEAASRRYRLSKNLKDQMYLSHARVGDYITQMADGLKSAVRHQVIDAYEKNKSPVALASDCYWMDVDHPEMAEYSATIQSRNWRRVAYTEIATLSEVAKLTELETDAAKKPTYMIFSGTNSGCSVCNSYLGTIVRLLPPDKIGTGETDSLSELGIKDELTDTAIWAGKNNIGRRRSGKDRPPWWICIPVHPYCFSEDTQVFTDHGWKYFFALTGCERIFSMCPITRVLEFVEWENPIDFKYSGNMIRVRANSYDSLTTPDHHVPIVANNQIELIEAQELLKLKKFSIPRMGSSLNINDGDFNPNMLDIYSWLTNTKQVDIEFGNSDKSCVSVKPYSGRVCCITLRKNHIMLTMRNEIIGWSGNCGHQFRPINPATQQYDKLTGLVKFKRTETEDYLLKMMAGNKVLQRIEDNRAAIQHRQDLQAADRLKGIYKRDSAYYG